ncbi:2Fe-2S iron-sulfur cluster-binding protein [Streptomyces sp. BB1-1-1]|uniref:2Fe-2S iron-sulfur cluster-binding protein n=1 Tax=Streptomyces sp. BB1-1-1 TaxID=3074430 RepID=UPI0028774DFE|nr:2Fe-2S iron-sulfur cluster-binding protein [Streptomyces sp. BB1-1-1]WND37296.1 2Fe-2S iron-sulfur cluster-binding protein [Streptomyces sp. BB1-1-1]
MTDDQHDERHGDQHGGGTPPSGGRWDPLPQGDYDDGATAFVKLPEGGVDALLASADSPLAAPGHGYVPPQITVAPATTAGTDPAATGTWAMPTAPVDGTQWHVPDAGQEPAAHQGYAEYPRQDPYGGSAPYDTNAPYDVHAGQGDRFTYRPGATGQWDFSEAAASDGTAPEPDAASGQDVTGQDVTGQWSIPVADGDLPDESGEFTQSSLAEQWGGTAPATLPGGAPAPWATQPAGQPWGDRAAEAAPGGPERPSEAATSAPPAPEPAAGPYVEAPAERAAETGPSASAADGTLTGEPVTDELQGAEEAFEGPAEPSADTGEDVAAESGPEAAEEPVTGPAPAAAQEREPEPGQEREPGREHESGREHEPGQEHESGQEHVPGQERERDPEAEPRIAPRTETDPAASETVPAVPASAADPAASQERAPAGPHEEHPLASYVLRVNGADRPVTDAWIGESLLYVLRERLGLAGAKDGCSQGECGACNVQVDGRLVASCLVPAVTSAGSEVRTVEGLAADGRPSDVQRALARRGAVQCGFCVPGMAMTLHNLLEGNPAPTELEARQALCGNLCRCSGYRGVLEAVKEVVAEREAHATADAAGTDADEPRIPHQAGPGAGGVNPSAFESQGPPGTPDAPGPHDQPYGENGQDGGHA